MVSIFPLALARAIYVQCLSVCNCSKNSLASKLICRMILNGLCTCCVFENSLPLESDSPNEVFRYLEAEEPVSLEVGDSVGLWRGIMLGSPLSIVLATSTNRCGRR